MASLIPIPTTRASDLLVSQRLLSQLQSDQRDLLRIQSQLSTGRRISAPSEDAPAAQRAIVLQRLLEQKQQVASNREVSQSYLTATEVALGDVSSLLTDVRGLAVSASGTLLSGEERQNTIIQLERAVEQLVSISNQKFRGRYLFGGTNTSEVPFRQVDQFISYQGNESHLQSFADVDLLVGSNVHGNEVFGALSQQVLGSTDVNPIISTQTRLSDLRGGEGISDGSFTISDGASTKTIDISSAETVGDLINLIESNPPTGRTITARVTNNGLSIAIDTAGGGNLTIAEIGGGTTAAELGIIDADGNGTAPIVGEDLDPILRLGTSLSDILGVRSQALVSSSAANSDLVFEYAQRGAAGDGITVQFVDSDLLQAGPGVTAGNETATFTDVATAAQASLRLNGTNNDLLLTANVPGTAANNIRIDITTAAIGDAANVSLAGNVLTIQIDSGGATTVGTLQNAIDLEGTFTASFDTSLEAGVNAGATINAASAGIGRGNTGNSGAEANTLLVHVDSGNTTANQVIAAVQNDPIVGELFNVRLDGKDNNGINSPGSGKISVDASGVTSGGSGVEFDQDSGLQIVNGGKTYTIDLSSAETIEEMLNIINGSGAHVLAEINASRTGIDIRSRLSGADFSIGENGGQTATHLGLRSLTGQTNLTELNHGQGIVTANGTDFTIHRRDGIDLEIDVSSATTIQDVIDLINNHVDNQDPATAVVAQLAEFGNGIELVDGNLAPTDTLAVFAQAGSQAAQGLGFVAAGQTQSQPPEIDGTTETLAASDVNPVETAGVFNTLKRLIDAVGSGDQGALERVAGLLDDDINRINFSRSEIGARQQSLDALGLRLEDEQVELQRTLSVEIDVDLVEAISEFTARQASFQASLQTTSQSLQLTLLDFL